jgi:DNA-binding transcriptional MerR regulator
MRRRDRGTGQLVGELAAEFGLNPRTIRYYDRIGLLRPAARTAAGYRLFGRRERDRLRFICKAKAVGLSLEEIREVLALSERGVAPCPRVLALVEEKLRRLEDHLRLLAEFRDELAALRAEASATSAAGDGICGLIERHVPRHEPQALRVAADVLSRRPVPKGRLSGAS